MPWVSGFVLILFTYFSFAGLSNCYQGFRPWDEQRNGQSRRPHYTFCCTGTISQIQKTSIVTDERKITNHSIKTRTGDAGVVRLPGPLSLLLLLLAGRLCFLRIAHRNHRPGATGIQPAGQGVGPGDGGPRCPSWLRGNPPVQLGLAGLTKRLRKVSKTDNIPPMLYESSVHALQWLPRARQHGI